MFIYDPTPKLHQTTAKNSTQALIKLIQDIYNICVMLHAITRHLRNKDTEYAIIRLQ